jgi:hypothetical protein
MQERRDLKAEAAIKVADAKSWGTGSASTQLLKACPSQEHFLAIAVMIAVEPFLHYASGVGHGSTTSTPDFGMADIAVPSYFFFTFRHN